MKRWGTELPIDEQLQKEQALAIKSLVVTNTRLQKIEDNVRAKIVSLSEYNAKMNGKQIVTNILESEFRMVLKVWLRQYVKNAKRFLNLTGLNNIFLDVATQNDVYWLSLQDTDMDGNVPTLQEKTS